MKDLKELGKELPTVKELGNWVPVGIEGKFVLAKKFTEDKVIIRPFKPEGKWEKVYEYFKMREIILNRMNREAEKKYEVELVKEERVEVKKAEFQGHKGKWITLDNGQHIFIRQGESVNEAIGRLKPAEKLPKAPKALMDYDRRVMSRLNRKDPDVSYIYDKAVDISDINLPEPRSEYRLKDNKGKIKETKAVPPILLVFDLKTQRFNIEDGVHRTNAAKELGYKAIPAVITYEK